MTEQTERYVDKDANSLLYVTRLPNSTKRNLSQCSESTNVLQWKQTRGDQQEANPWKKEEGVGGQGGRGGEDEEVEEGGRRRDKKKN